jgi:uncharacterized protein YeaO (DUF488 family)
MGESPCFAHLLDEEGRMPEPTVIRLRRVYEGVVDDPREARVLVDRVWPRGVPKNSLALTSWARELAPSNELRRWFGHDPARWPEFKTRYRRELAAKEPGLVDLARTARSRPLTLLYSARDSEHNQAVVLKEVLEEALLS